ncbi:MAG: metal-dependent hydrolase [Desulfoplanes sp.]|jgi:L-ascorbate metabolism protein UlaG (beta-lactamase superfamily)
MSTFLTWHGHANFEITTPDQTIFVDPWFSGNPKADIPLQDVHSADLVLVTHDHSDHLGDTLQLCRQTGARLAAQVEVAGDLIHQGLDQSQVLNGIGCNIGGTIEYAGTRITMTQAFHSCASGTPAGFIIRLKNGYTIYHAGDTGIFADMKTWGELYPMDLALLPTGDVFTMDAEQAALACSFLQCRTVVPMHWGTFPALAQSMDHFADLVKKKAPDTRVVIMQPGERIELV